MVRPPKKTGKPRAARALKASTPAAAGDDAGDAGGFAEAAQPAQQQLQQFELQAWPIGEIGTDPSSRLRLLNLT